MIAAPEHGLSPQDISPAALTIVRTLRKAGYAADVVGGCIRDLLVGQTPKDFDVVTDATPDQIRDLFRRARLVGRRFRLAHVRIGREVIEVATYRGSALEGDHVSGKHRHDGRFVSNNVFGARDQDALRRDFTVNSLYYDPLDDTLVDYVGGIEDIRSRTLRLIGDPRTRFAEDPVRMLRAVRFKAKLGFDLEPQLAALLPQMASHLSDVSSARLFEEVLKVFHNGCGESAFRDLYQTGLFQGLFPDTACYYSDLDLDPKKGLIPCALRNTDQRIRQGKPVISPFLFAVLFWRPVAVEAARREARRVSGPELIRQSAVRVLEHTRQPVAIPRRVSTVMIEIWEMQARLLARRPRTIRRLMDNRRFRAGYDFLLLLARAGEADRDIAQWWTKIQAVEPGECQEMIRALGPKKTGRRRKSRARRKSS